MQIVPPKSFASDNNSGIHPDILKAIATANSGHALAYGADATTKRVEQLFKQHFGEHAEVFFVFTGTAANVLGLSAAMRSYHAVICSEYAHINVDECGAPERMLGSKLLTLPTENGKITIEGIKKHLHGFGDQHHSQPKVISVSQTTELGTVYSVAELRELVSFAHANDLLFHVDGARLSNAAASLGVTFKEMVTDTGVDILSFGGTKNGMLCGESVVFLKQGLSDGFKFVRKQSMQLASKMRFVTAQYEAYLNNGLCYAMAEHANRMARLLADEVAKLPQVKITQQVQANGVFAILPKPIISTLQKQYFFYEWNEELSEVRWMTSFDTTEGDIYSFVEAIKNIL